MLTSFFFEGNPHICQILQASIPRHTFLNSGRPLPFRFQNPPDKRSIRRLDPGREPDRLRQSFFGDNSIKPAASARARTAYSCPQSWPGIQPPWCPGMLSVFSNDPYCMNNTWNISKNCQQNIQPESPG
jgi:hypothetical protein